MFEDYTYDALLSEVLSGAPVGIDTRQGSIFFDAISGVVLKISKLYTDLDLVFKLTQIDTATGTALDAKATEYGIFRHKGTRTQYYAVLEGRTPDIGERFFTDGQYFALKQTADSTLYFESESAGLAGNDIYEGTAAIPVNNVRGLTKSSFGAIMEYGTDDEEDESLRIRIREKIAGPAENGNKQHYKTWCEGIEGVGRARIFPLWNGPNTVMSILINSLGKPCSEGVVNTVQQHIDPNDLKMTVTIEGKTYNVGDGLGEGVANLGAHFTAAPAGETGIVVEFDAELASGATKETAAEAVMAAIENYFMGLSMDIGNPEDIAVRVSAIGAVLSSVPVILDYKNLTLNGQIENIIPGVENVPVLKGVEISVVR